MSQSSVFSFEMWEETPALEQPKEAEIQVEKEQTKTIFETIKGMTSIASLMRVFGAMTVIAAMSAFLMQDWAAGNDISRYYMLLSQTGLLALVGFGLSYLLKENKGARVFFGLGLISITVNMATLGALIFSMTQWGSELVHYPGFAKWQAVDIGAILAALAATFAVSAPVAIFSYKVLARRSASLLAGLSLFTNFLLLFPVRESIFVGALAVAAILIPVYFIHQRMQQDNSLRTPEGWFAIASIFAPAVIIIFRSLWLYPIDELLMLTLSGTAFVGLRFCTSQMEADSVARKAANALSVAIAFMVAGPLSSLVDSAISGALGDSIAYNVFGVSFAALMIDLAQRNQSANKFAALGVLVLAVSHIIPVVFINSFIAPILCVLAGIAAIAIGRHFVSPRTIMMGGIMIVAGAAQQVIDMVELINFSSWITLAVTGSGVIIAASLIERHGAVIKLKWNKFVLAGKEER